MNSTGFFIGAGWANSCANQLFTNSWIRCLKPTEESNTSTTSYTGGGATQLKLAKKLLIPKDSIGVKNIDQLLQEDIEILEFLMVVVNSEVL